jgi:hypothetical protein
MTARQAIGSSSRSGSLCGWTSNPLCRCAHDHSRLRPGANALGHCSGCAQRGIDCQVSMERRMACGIGVCQSCRRVPHRRLERHNPQALLPGRPVFDAAPSSWRAT